MTGCWSRPAGGRAWPGSGSRPSGWSRAPRGCRSTPGCRSATASGRSATRRHMAAHLRRQVPGARRRRQRPRPRREADYEAVPRVVFTDPQAAAVGAADGGSPPPPHSQGAAHRDLRARVCDAPRVPHPGLRRQRLPGAHAVGPEAGEWLQQATASRSARASADGLLRRGPALPDVLEAFLHALRDLEATTAVCPPSTVRTPRPSA